MPKLLSLVVVFKGLEVFSEVVIYDILGDAVLYKDIEGNSAFYIREWDSYYTFLCDVPRGKESLKLSCIKEIFPCVIDQIFFRGYEFRFVKKGGDFFVLTYEMQHSQLDPSYLLKNISSSCIGDIVKVPSRRGTEKFFLKIDRMGKFVVIS